MRISEFFKLRRSQPSLDFVDVDIYGDTRIFIDPRALRLLPSSWGDECVALIQNYFRKVITLIRNGDHDAARTLLSCLSEPNVTHLGLSKGRARGRGMGMELARDVWNALRKSEAAKSGLLEDLEDTILMVYGISHDIISDISTNIIRKPLIEYTQNMSNYYGIPLQSGIDSGPVWDPKRQTWDAFLVELPVTKWGKLLLVPKAIVRRRMDYDVAEYYNDYILEYYRQVELSANSELVRLLKDGRNRVTDKDLMAKYGTGKAIIIRETQKHPELLHQYRKDKLHSFSPPMDHAEIASSEGSPLPDWDQLLLTLNETKPGPDSSCDYENAIESVLTAIFYPSLTNPQKQVRIHEGRKIIDLTYTNMAKTGFFDWLSRHYPAPHIFVECKNYSSDPGNPELDQLSGRFSPSRGKVGILACRKFINKKLFIKRCRDTAKDDRGFIIPLEDGDLVKVVSELKSGGLFPTFKFLKDCFDLLIM